MNPSKRLSLKSAANILASKKNILILCHDYPDGDTLGSAAALHIACSILGKKSKVLCNSEIPAKFKFLFNNVKNIDFKPDLVLSIDVADEKLLGEELCCIYGGHIDISIDHHVSNTKYAKSLILDSKAAATAEIIYKLIQKMDINITADMANCLYTAICTDTGCFKFSNTTEKTHRIAAKLIQLGAEASKINKIMFDSKSKVRLKIESAIYRNLSYHFNGRCAITYLDFETFDKSGATEGDLDGIASLPIQIENVEISAYIREKEPGIFKVSFRSCNGIDASQLGKRFNGGGHFSAAACVILGDLKSVKDRILKAIVEEYAYLK